MFVVYVFVLPSATNLLISKIFCPLIPKQTILNTFPVTGAVVKVIVSFT